jgi:RNA recognition motif-containing protein
LLSSVDRFLSLLTHRLLVAEGGSSAPAQVITKEIQLKKIYVGNMPFSMSEDEVRNLFAVHGAVESVQLVMDRDTGRPRGFGFVEMADGGAVDAINALNGYNASGRQLRVNEAQERAPREQKRW